MIKLEKYAGDKTYVRGDGGLATPQWMEERWPAIATVTHVIETDESGQCLLAIDPLSRLRAIFDIDAALTEDQAIAALETIRNTPPEMVESPEQRIAAALEYQNLTTMEDVL